MGMPGFVKLWICTGIDLALVSFTVIYFLLFTFHFSLSTPYFRITPTRG